MCNCAQLVKKYLVLQYLTRKHILTDFHFEASTFSQQPNGAFISNKISFCYDFYANIKFIEIQKREGGVE